ncbi:MAG: DUF3574 domain-containing protein, partial [Desulfurococcaceae archaeon]
FLENIRGVVCFRERLKIYAPTCHGKCENMVKKLIDEVTNVAGGCTVYDAEGFWIDEEGHINREPVKVVEAGHHCLSRQELERIARAITEYARSANQQAIAIYGSNFYIAPTTELLKAYEQLIAKKPVL